MLIFAEKHDHVPSNDDVDRIISEKSILHIYLDQSISGHHVEDSWKS